MPSAVHETTRLRFLPPVCIKRVFNGITFSGGEAWGFVIRRAVIRVEQVYAKISFVCRQSVACCWFYRRRANLEGLEERH